MRPSEIQTVLVKLFVFIETNFRALLGYYGNLDILITSFKLVIFIFAIFFSRQVIVFLSKKIAKESLERFKENKSLTTALVIIGIYFFFVGYYIIDNLGLENVSTFKINLIKFLWLTLFPVLTLNLLFMSEKTVLFLKNILIMRQSYFLLTCLFALALTFLNCVPDVESIRESLTCLIKHKNSQPVDEIYLDFTFFIENQYIFAVQLVWFFLYINLLDIFLDPNIFLINKILFACFPGIGFFNKNNESLLEKTVHFMFPKNSSMKNNLGTVFLPQKSTQTFSYRPLIVFSREHTSFKTQNNFLISLLDKTKIQGITTNSQQFLTDITHCSSILSRKNTDLYLPTVETMSTDYAKEFKVWLSKKGFDREFHHLNKYFYSYEDYLKIKIYSDFLLEQVLEEQEIARWFEEEIIKETGLSRESLLIRLARSLLDDNLTLFEYNVKPVRPEILYKLNKLTHILFFLNENEKEIVSKYRLLLSDEAKGRPYKISVRSQLLTQFVSANSLSKKYGWTLTPNNSGGLGDYFYKTPNNEEIILMDIKSWYKDFSNKKDFNRKSYSNLQEIIAKFVTQKKTDNIVIGLIVTSGMERFSDTELELSLEKVRDKIIKGGNFNITKTEIINGERIKKIIEIDPIQAKGKLTIKVLNIK